MTGVSKQIEWTSAPPTIDFQGEDDLPAISYSALTPWANFHLTTPPFDQGDGLPGMRIAETAAIHCADVAAAAGTRRFAETCAVLQAHLQRFLERLNARRNGEVGTLPLARPYAHGIIGQGWSYSALIGAKDFQIDLGGLAGFSLLSETERHHNCFGADRIALVSGGTRLREIANWAEPFGLTVPNSGTHLGASIAGLIGTSSHGSRIGSGGIQNAVHGIHLVTGPDTNLWIERASRPILSDTAIAAIGAQRVRDDAVFEDVLVHLGGMGIVNGVALELAANDLYGLLKSDKALPPDALDLLATGRFRDIARYLDFDEDPAFYELTIDPFDYSGAHALHIMYFNGPEYADPCAEQAQLVRAPDAIATLVPAASTSEMQVETDGASVLGGAIDAFQWLRHAGGFEPGSVPFAPVDGTPRAYRWQQLHGDQITTGMPGALYNASYAVSRAELPRAIPAICAAVAELPPTFVITIRFVTRAAGTLGFTRFEEAAVIDIDGLSPLYWQMQAASAPDTSHAPFYEQMAKVVPTAALMAEQALAAAAIDFSSHWAKLGTRDPARVEAGFGPSDDPNSRISRWRDTRRSLLEPAMQAVFWNDALIALGILDQPEF